MSTSVFGALVKPSKEACLYGESRIYYIDKGLTCIFETTFPFISFLTNALRH